MSEVKTSLSTRIKQWRAQFPSPKARLSKDLADEIDATLIPEFNTRAEKTYALLHELQQRPVCAVCKGSVKFGKNGGFFEVCSLSCAAKNPRTRAKTQDTNIERFGVPHAAQSEHVQRKIRATNQERYGADSSSMHHEIKQKIAETNLARYGNICSLNGENTANKKRATWEHLRGVDNPAKCSKVQEKKRETVIGITDIRKKEHLEMFKDHGILALFSDWVGAADYSFKHECGTVFTDSFIGYAVPRCPMCFPLNVSKEELAVRAMIPADLCEFNVRGAIGRRELDIYIPSKNLAIEINGMFWHHDDREHLFPLLKKTEIAAENNIQVLHFWDFEILEKPEIVKNIIHSKLGLLPKIGARELSVQRLTAQESAEFLMQTHLAGFAKARYHFALVKNGTVYAVALFGKARFEKQSAWELVRFSSIGTVVGGLSRLIAAFRKIEPRDDLISYADRRYSKGLAYASVGFRFIGNTRANYFYFKGQRRIHRQQAQKHRRHLILENNITGGSEHDTMLLNGWNRCSDCGSAKFILDAK